MGEEGEPRENIGGETGSVLDAIDPDSTDEVAAIVVERLGELYWRKAYGGQDAFRCLVRTILSQNTSDVASQPAYDALLDRFGPDELALALATTDEATIAELIRPAGLYTRKAAVIATSARRVLDDFGDPSAFDRYVREAAYDEARETLLAFDGVGPKTADCVLLFAGGRTGVFPVDTHVYRIARRMGLVAPDADHEAVRASLEAGVPADRCGFGHTAMIQFGREHCTARSPTCLQSGAECPLGDLCDRVGIDVGADQVIDPEETLE